MRLSPKRMSARLGERIDQAAAPAPVPAGSEPPATNEEQPRTSARERGAMRRRARRLRRSREVLLLELGALVFESERRGRRDPNLVAAKVERLRAVDDEARALSTALGEDRPLVELVTAGVAGMCASCGSLLGTDARFCSNCGTPASQRQRGATAAGGVDGGGANTPDSAAQGAPVGGTPNPPAGTPPPSGGEAGGPAPAPAERR